MGCYIRVSTHIAGLAAKPKDVLDTLDLTNFGVKKLFLYIGVCSVTIKDFATLQVPRNHLSGNKTCLQHH